MEGVRNGKGDGVNGRKEGAKERGKRGRRNEVWKGRRGEKDGSRGRTFVNGKEEGDGNESME